MTEDEDWLNVDADAENATGEATAEILESIAASLREAPEDARYDFEIVINERPAEGDQLRGSATELPEEEKQKRQQETQERVFEDTDAD